MNRVYSLIFDGKYDKKDIAQIQNLLMESNISGIINFLEDKGVSAKAIGQYLRDEIKITDANKAKK
jgi:hypothetical protein